MLNKLLTVLPSATKKRTLLEYDGFQKSKKTKLTTYSVEYTLSIYGYKKNNDIVYVGQTRQTVLERDNGHLNGDTVFDMDYQSNAGLYKLDVIEQKMVHKQVSVFEDKDELWQQLLSIRESACYLFLSQVYVRISF